MVYHLLFVIFFGGQQLEWTLNTEFETKEKCEAAAQQIARMGPGLQIRGAFACYVEYRA